MSWTRCHSSSGNPEVLIGDGEVELGVVEHHTSPLSHIGQRALGVLERAVVPGRVAPRK